MNPRYDDDDASGRGGAAARGPEEPRGDRPDSGGTAHRGGDGQSRRRRKHRSGKRAARAQEAGGEEPRLGLARHIVERLRLLARILFEETTVGRAARPLEAPFDLKIQLHPEGSAVAPDEDARQLVSALRRRIAELAIRGQVYRAGRVFCYWCESSACAHAAPPTETSVFGGYMPTGRPVWREFASAVLARRDPRIESLYRKPPETIAFVEREEELLAAQLPTFGRGSPAYHVIGQVALGFLRAPASALDAAPAPLALTLQAVRSMGSSEELRLDLNVIGVLSDGRDVEGLFSDGFEPDLDASVRWARSALSDVERRLNALRRNGDLEKADAVAPQAKPILEQLVHRLEKVFRQRVRRTRHARDRTAEGERPTRKAIEDALGAADHEILFDTGEDTFVVLGPRGRVHVFSPGGRLVTSIVFSRDAIDRRILRRRWRPAEPEEIQRFRGAIAEDR